MICVDHPRPSVRLNTRAMSNLNAGQQLTIFCDLDGPIIDVSRRYYHTYQQAIAATQSHYKTLGQDLLLTPMTKERFWHLKLERIPDMDIAARSGLMGEQIPLFLEKVQWLVNQPSLLLEDALQAGVRKALTQLQLSGVRLALVTLRDQGQALELLQRFELDSFFAWVRGTQDQGAAYVNYSDYKQALLGELIAEMHLNPWEPAWMIGDTEADILAAKAYNLPSIAVCCGMRSQAFLHRLEPTSVQPNLLTAVQYVVNEVWAQ